METSELTVCITGAAGHIATALYIILCITIIVMFYLELDRYLGLESL